MVAASGLDRLNQLGGVGESHQWPPLILFAEVVTSMIINPLTVLTLYVLPFAEGSFARVWRKVQLSRSKLDADP